MTNPLISIITVNYNQSSVTRDFLLSLYKISYPSFEIIVVDNGSTGDSPKELLKEFPRINLILSPENLGFAGGNNLGVKAANGKYCLFINNDTEVEPDFLEPLVERLENNQKIGMISPKIKYFFSRDTIQYAGYTKYHPITLRQHLIGFKKKDDGLYDDSSVTFAGHGAAMMVPMAVINEVGMMAELFFLYYEEHDWCERIKKAGYTAFYEAKSIVWHKESLSTGKESPLKTYYLTRNRMIFARRNVKKGMKWITILYLCTLVPLNFSIKYLKNRQFELFKAAWRGLIWSISRSYKSISEN